MRQFKILLVVFALAMVMIPTKCEGATKWNVFLMGDSIIDNYPHSANGLAYYMKSESAFSNVYDYSYEGTKVCDLKYQTRKVIKKLPYFKGKNNVVIVSCGTNDYFKKCGCDNPSKLLKKRLKEIKAADSNVRIIVIIPTHIYRVRNDAKIRAIYDYQQNDKEMRKISVSIRTGDYLGAGDIKSDCLHFTSGGYTKTVKEIKKILGV